MRPLGWNNHELACVHVYVCECACACMCMCLHVCMCARACMCVRVCVWGEAIPRQTNSLPQPTNPLRTNWVRLPRWPGLRVLSAVVHRHLRRPHASPVHKPPRAGAHRVLAGSAGTCAPPRGTRRGDGGVWRGPLTSEYPRGCSVSSQPTSPRRSVPLKAMARCLPLWAIFSGFFSHFWLCTVIVTYLPTYISSVLHVSIREVCCPPGARGARRVGSLLPVPPGFAHTHQPWRRP